ncbi:methionine--tRNA ligase subunit beta [Candidatus Woesearchaeota archaeon]|nr:methionine--tRNA ligase subunit beta [Candidatus Woesearchaeota archaeon]
MEQVEFSDFKKLEIRVGKILNAERIPKTEKLYKLKIEIGKGEQAQIVTSLVPYYKEEELINQSIVVLVNLKPTKFAGEVSQGMLLCAEKEDGSECVLLTTEREISPGTRIT